MGKDIASSRPIFGPLIYRRPGEKGDMTRWALEELLEARWIGRSRATIDYQSRELASPSDTEDNRASAGVARKPGEDGGAGLGLKNAKILRPASAGRPFMYSIGLWTLELYRVYASLSCLEASPLASCGGRTRTRVGGAAALRGTCVRATPSHLRTRSAGMTPKPHFRFAFGIRRPCTSFLFSVPCYLPFLSSSSTHGWTGKNEFPPGTVPRRAVPGVTDPSSACAPLNRHFNKCEGKVQAEESFKGKVH
ncbi:hypothetical protein C8R47DRAFT_1080499 [Mycena vitilis]|nr:hypothetical protein C8R47DRAFT_1080499 [Mycena vitilis]